MMLILQTGCAAVSAGDFCQIYEPVYTADADTAETRRRCDRNNAVWWQLCSGESVNADSARDAP